MQICLAIKRRSLDYLPIIERVAVWDRSSPPRCATCMQAFGPEYGCCEASDIDVLLLLFCRSHSLKAWALVGAAPEALRRQSQSLRDANADVASAVRRMNSDSVTSHRASTTSARGRSGQGVVIDARATPSSSPVAARASHLRDEHCVCVYVCTEINLCSKITGNEQRFVHEHRLREESRVGIYKRACHGFDKRSDTSNPPFRGAAGTAAGLIAVGNSGGRSSALCHWDIISGVG
ncbi:hypothetical protein ANCDUO_14153 [Ancylostoma duodenale]|uniref:Uncharacterized protein n=1 Tax=Ancylostoma duodenale TaxID=51022 RepID=A0A0C2G9W0_9BILA|nr:hypothetical protein ANCDUO_14153 [Ancylostoma duodenale]